MFLPVALLLASAAHAHFPHDAARWVAVSPGDEPRWLMTTLVRSEANMVARSEDRRDFEALYALPGGDVVQLSGALFSDDRLLVGTEAHGLWVSEAAGLAFAQHPDLPTDSRIGQIVASPDVLDDHIGLLTADDGVWRSLDAGLSWTPALLGAGAALVDLELSPRWLEDGRAAAVSQRGLLWLSEDAGQSWERRAAVDGLATQVATGEERLWIATANVGLWVSEDDGLSWSRSALPLDAVYVVLDLGDDIVLAAGAMEAVYRSTDGGLTWSYAHDGLQDPESDQPSEGIHYFHFLDTPEGVYLASWEGVALSEDDGLTWEPFETEVLENLRGVSLSRSDEGLVAITASYGGGINRMSLNGTGEPISYSFTKQYPRHALASPDWDALPAVFVTSGNFFYTTVDGGRHWNAAGADELEHAERLGLAPGYDESPFLVVVGEQDGHGDFIISNDHGESWHRGEREVECTDRAFSAAFSPEWAQDGVAWITSEGQGDVLQTVDGGESWSLLISAGCAVFDAAGTPGGESVFLATEQGLMRVRGGQLETVAYEGVPIFALAIAPDFADDPTLFLLAATGIWARSEDGGETWQELAAPSLEMPRAVALSPDFSTDGTLAVAGYGGAWASEDRGNTWTAMHGFELYQEDHPAFRPGSGWTEMPNVSASGEGLLVSGEPGACLSFGFLGIGVDLLAPMAADGGACLVTLDDGEPRWVSLAGASVNTATVASFSDLQDGWHELTVQVAMGRVSLDGALVYRLPQEEPAPDTGQDVGSRCACSGGRAQVFWILPFLLGPSVRRRRQPAAESVG